MADREIRREIEQVRRETAAARANAAYWQQVALEDRIAENERRVGLGVKPLPLMECLFERLNADRAATTGWKAAARAADDDQADAAAAVETMEAVWLRHLAAGGDPGLEVARAMFPGRWFELWRSCR